MNFRGRMFLFFIFGNLAPLNATLTLITVFFRDPVDVQLTRTNQERADTSSSLRNWTVSRAVADARITNINLIN